MNTSEVLPQERSVARWVTRQFRDGCNRIVLRSRVDGVVQDVEEWILDSIHDVASVAEDIRDAMVCAEPLRLEEMLFGLFAFRPDDLTHSGAAFLLRSAA